MTDVPVTSAPVRQAALALHAMSERDRNWLLETLPAGEREQLLPLLEELRVLGIPRDESLLAEVAREQAPSPAETDWLRDMDASGTRALASVLGRQPAEFTRTVLALVPERASTPLRAALGWSDAHERHVPAPAPALERAIRAALEPRWRSALAHHRPVTRPSRWHAFKAQIASLGRLQ